MIQILLSLLLWSIVYGIDEANALPVGLTLSPLGGTFQVFNHDPVSTYVFTDLFKHCNDFYIRSVSCLLINILFQLSSLLFSFCFLDKRWSCQQLWL